MKRTRSLRTTVLALLFVASLGVTSLSRWDGGRANVAKAQAKPKPAFKPTKFKSACVKPSYPMPAPASAPVIDSLCGLAGIGGAGPEGMQDMVKNNFCAKGTPRVVTVADLTDLQAKVEANPAINFGSAGKGPGRRDRQSTARR